MNNTMISELKNKTWQQYAITINKFYTKYKYYAISFSYQEFHMDTPHFYNNNLIQS